MLDFWYYGDNDGPNWERDFNSGQEIGATILLLVAAVLGMIVSLTFGLTDQGVESAIWFP
jgi:hypothetical protein